MSDIRVSPADVKAMGEVCKKKATEIQDLMRAVDGQIKGVNWHSQAKKRFDDDWALHVKNLTLLQESLRDLGEAAVKMGTNYQSADDAYKA